MLEDHKNLFTCPECDMPMFPYSASVTSDGISCHKVRCAFCRPVSPVIVSLYNSPGDAPKRFYNSSTVSVHREKWTLRCDCSDATAEEAGIGQECRFDFRTEGADFRVWYDTAARTILLSCPADTARIYRRMIIRAMELEVRGKNAD